MMAWGGLYFLESVSRLAAVHDSTTHPKMHRKQIFVWSLYDEHFPIIRYISRPT